MKSQENTHKKISAKLWLWSIGLIVPFIALSGLLLYHEKNDIWHVAKDMAILFTFAMIVVFILAHLIMKTLLNPMIDNRDAIMSRNIELESANQEIQALYEEMTASEEMLRFNYEELERYRSALEDEKDNYRKILVASNEAYWQYDFSTRAFSVTNFSREMSESKTPFDDFLDRIYEEDINKVIHYFSPDNQADEPIFEVKFRLRIDGIDIVYHWFQLLGIREGQGIFGSLTDIHHDVINKERIEFYAFHDPVLGLYNMDFLDDIVNNLYETENNNDAHMLLVVGVVGFGRILNAYGKNLTDIMLFQLSAEISHVFSEAKYISVLHSGRFAIWMICDDQNTCGREQMAALEVSLTSKVGVFSNIEMPINIAYGATLVSRHKVDQDNSHAISEAETAFEHAVNKGIYHQIQWYDDSLKIAKDRELAKEQLLLKAIEKNELYLMYQPQYCSIDKDEIVGYEALLRWSNKTLGFVAPIDFVPLAESIDYINTIGRFVIKEAILFIQKKNQEGKNIKVSINASYKELLQKDYVSHLLEMLKAHDVSINQLHIEITETTISEYIDVVRDNLEALCQNGFEMHMDDFGTGYSSLYQLGRMPFHILKIDKSFVWGLGTDGKMRALTNLIIDIAHRMDMKIIAEGVETKSQYDILKAMGCDYYQGYLLSKPLLPSEI